MIRTVLLLFLLALPCRAAITVTLAGTAGGSGSSYITTPTYNQAAGNCMVVIGQDYNTTQGSPSDVAGDSFTAIIPRYAAGNQFWITVWAVYGSLGSAVNAVTLGSISSSYGSLTYYDVNVGGTCTSALLDLATSATTVTTGSSISKTITTQVANEAIITTVFQEAASLTAATAPTSFSAASVVNSVSLSSYRVVSAIQSSVTLTWSSITASTTAGYDMIVVSLKGIVAASKSPPMMVR